MLTWRYDGFFAVERFHAIGLNVQGHFGLAEYARQGVFILEYAVAILVLYGATRIRRWPGAVLLAVLWLLTTVDLAAHAIYGRPAGIGNIGALNASAAMLGAALREYGHTIAVAAGKVSVLFVPLVIKVLFSRRPRKPLILPLLLAGTLAGMYGIILVKRGPPALIGFPKGFSYGFGSLAIEANTLLERPRYLPARAIDTDPDGIGSFRNVVVIADLTAMGPNFIFINKDGAHFPYGDYIDPSLASGDKAADYLTALRANTVDFLMALQARLPAGTIVFYTSDHGQNLTTRATHCNTGDEATPEEYRVPFLALATDAGVQARLKQAALIQHDRLTHLEFSESVREALGYRVQGVRSLFAPAPIDTPFCGLYGSPKVFFGVQPSCKALPAAAGLADREPGRLHDREGSAAAPAL